MLKLWHTQIILGAVLLAFGGKCGAAPPSVAERPYQSRYASVTVKLRCPRPKARLNERTAVEFELNVSGVTDLFNPLLDTSLKCPGRMVLHNDDGKPICDLLYDFIGGSRGIQPRNFYWFSGEQYIGCRKSVLFDEHNIGLQKAMLTPGKYYLQIVYDELLFARPIDAARATAEEMDYWRAEFSDIGVLRSNAVEIEVLP